MSFVKVPDVILVSISDMCLPVEFEPCVFMHYSLESGGACSHIVLTNIVLLVIIALSRRAEKNYRIIE